MWNKKLLRTKRTTQPCLLVQKASALMIMMGVIVQMGVVGARSASVVENNELDSATAMLAFRNALQGIGYDESSLTLLLQVGASNDVVHQVRGLRFHAVENPLLCDGDLSPKSRLNVEFVQVLPDAVESGGATRNNVKYLCAVWPVAESTSAGQLEWLSANGIERRSFVDSWEQETPTGHKDTQYLAMHLGGNSATDEKR